eukprot:10453338-Alexandrium_andersonii.AAC.1
MPGARGRLVLKSGFAPFLSSAQRPVMPAQVPGLGPNTGNQERPGIELPSSWPNAKQGCKQASA